MFSIRAFAGDSFYLNHFSEKALLIDLRLKNSFFA